MPSLPGISHHFDHFGGRANESDLRSLAYLGKVGVLGKKAIAGVNGVHIRDFRGTDYLRNIQVTLAAARRANANSFIGKSHVQGISVSLGIDCHGGNAKLFARANDPQRDFPAVGD
jgi:hypothetical protein